MCRLRLCKYREGAENCAILRLFESEGRGVAESCAIF